MIHFARVPIGLVVFICLLGINAFGLRVFNAGQNGNNTRNALARFDDDVAAENPDVCFIAFGMNDAMGDSNPVPLDEYRKNLLRLAEKCRTSGIRPVFITVNPVNKEKLYERHKAEFYEQQGGPNAMIDRYNLVIKEVASETGADVIDWHKLVMERSGSSIESGAMLRMDGVHLSPEGLAALADLTADWVKKSGETNATIVAFGDSITKQGWISRVAAICEDSRPVYETSIPSVGSHIDTCPPGRLLDGLYKSAVSDSLQYDGDPEITFVFPQMHTVNEIEVCCFNAKGYFIDYVNLEISVDGVTWQTAGSVSGQTLPIQQSIRDTAVPVRFSVGKDILKFKIKIARQAGSSRVLISEVFIHK